MCGSSCCADIICDEVADNYMVSKQRQAVVSEGINMSLVYRLLCLLGTLTPGPDYTAGSSRDMVFTSHFWKVFH